MNYYKITYSINANNERVYPPKMKGVVFVTTQDHPTEHFMVAGTQATMAADGQSIVALTSEAADALAQQLRDAFPKLPSAAVPPGVPR